MKNIHWYIVHNSKNYQTINADQLLNEVGCICPIEYNVGIQKGDVYKGTQIQIHLTQA